MCTTATAADAHTGRRGSGRGGAGGDNDTSNDDDNVGAGGGDGASSMGRSSGGFTNRHGVLVMCTQRLWKGAKLTRNRERVRCLASRPRQPLGVTREVGTAPGSCEALGEQCLSCVRIAGEREGGGRGETYQPAYKKRKAAEEIGRQFEVLPATHAGNNKGHCRARKSSRGVGLR